LLEWPFGELRKGRDRLQGGHGKILEKRGGEPGESWEKKVGRWMLKIGGNFKGF